MVAIMCAIPAKIAGEATTNLSRRLPPILPALHCTLTSTQRAQHRQPRGVDSANEMKKGFASIQVIQFGKVSCTGIVSGATWITMLLPNPCKAHLGLRCWEDEDYESSSWLCSLTSPS